MRKCEEWATTTEIYNPAQKLAMLSKAVRNVEYLRAVENTNEMLNIGGNPSVDYDKYFSLLRATAQRKDAQERQLTNPKNRVSQHLFTYDYVDHGSSMFADAWDANEEDFFDDQYEETLHLLQHQEFELASFDNKMGLQFLLYE